MNEDVEKRRAMRRRQIRRRRLIIGFIFFLIVAVIAFAIMCFTVLFPIKNITVSGSEIYTKKEIKEACQIKLGDNLFAVSQSKTQAALQKNLPYIDEVEIKRDLPDTLILAVTDAVEYACYNVEGKYFVVSDKGNILAEYDEKPENVFEIIANGVNCEVGTKVQYENEGDDELINIIIDNLNLQGISINSVDVTNSLKITVRVENRFDVNLGTNENIDKKIAHLKGMIESIGDRSGSINLEQWTRENSQGSFVAEKK